MFVLGTAGHVDHGKSTFLSKFTGMSPDRLPEEKKRGMTIDLNFVWFEHEGQKVGIVDVPGHHRFVKNMVSGVMQIDGFLFLVAADDGWMPQSEEHLQVLRSLGVDRGLAIVSKTDLVKSERTAQVIADVQGRLKAAFGKDFPVLPFAPEEGDKLTDIQRAVGQLLQALPHSKEDQAARLWIDRVFVPKGMGGVVTGTLREGSLRVGDTVRLLPEGREALIKGLQSYQASVDTAHPVSRVAVQLGKIEVAELKRGQLLIQGPAPALSTRCDTELEFFVPTKLKNQHFAFHLGTLRADAFVIPMSSEKEIHKCLARIKFSHAVPLRSGDPFLLRTVGEEKTVAGGRVIDPTPTLSSHKKAIEELGVWDRSPGGWVRYALTKNGVAEIETLAAQSIFPKAAIEQVAQNYRSLHGGRIADAKLWDPWLAMLTQVVEVLHDRGKPVLAKEEVLAALKRVIARPISTLNILLEDAVKSGKLKEVAGGFQKPGFARQWTSEERQVLELCERLFGEKPGAPISIKEFGAAAKAVRKVQTEAKNWVALAQDHVMKREDYDVACHQVRQKLSELGEATTSVLREHLNTSRKLAVLILERMDQDRLTYLKDGLRRLLK